MISLYKDYFYKRRYQDRLFKFPAELIDGALVTEALIEAKVPIQLLPRQMVVAYSPSASSTAAGFTHGVPGSSSLAGVTFLADRRVRRALLQKHGVRVPEGATFSYQSKLEVVKYIRRIGYPVVVKEAMAQELGERGIFASNAQELDAAIARLRVIDERHFSSQADYKNSAYAITGLLPTVTTQDGVELKNERHRFLLEEKVPGDKVRLIVLHGSVACALRKSEGEGYHSYSLLKEPQRYQAAVNQVMHALPGITTLCIDVVVDDASGDKPEESCCIVEVNERLHLHNVLFSSPWLAKKLARQVVSIELGLQGERAFSSDLMFKRHIEIPCVAKGLVDSNGFIKEIDKIVSENRVGSRISWKEVNALKGEVSFILKGGLSEASYLLNSVSCGHGIAVRPMSIDVF